jgi:hypothetical protein
MLGASEAAVGMLLIGWSVGLLLILVKDAMKHVVNIRE